MRDLLKKYGKPLVAFFREQSLVRKAGLITAFIGALLAGGVLMLFLLVWTGALGHVPNRAELRLVENPVATEVYSADSVLLGRYFIQERSTIRYDQLTPAVTHALIATEDARFFKHGGIDYRSTARVLVKTILLRRESSGGGSTITQQLAKNLYPRKKYWLLSTPVNKIREMLVARRLESIYSKEDILVLYLNTIPFGDNTYGIKAAAERFFSSSVRNLTTDQAAVLVGMLKATYLYNPRLFPDRARSRRNVVLSQMEKYGYLESPTADSLQALPLELAYKKLTHHSGLAPYFRAYIKDELEKWCRTNRKADGEPYNLYTDGLKIYTTIRAPLQQYAEAAVTKQMASLQKEFDAHWGKQKPWKDRPEILKNAVRRSSHYRRLKGQGLTEDEIMDSLSVPVPMSVFTWDGEKEMTLSPLDSVARHLKFLNAGFMAMDPRTGHVLAWVGGIDHNYFQYDHVKETTRRQVGSTFKPIVYAAALEQGIKPCAYIPAEKMVYTDMEDWSPANSEEDYYDRKYSMEGGLTYSVNTVSVRLAEQTGLEHTVSLARKMGIKSNIPQVPSIALGTPSVSVSEMVAAYACFVNQGRAVTPVYITAITNRRDSVLTRFEEPEPGEQVISEETAQMIVHMLKRVVKEGTGASLQWKYGIGGDVAGKTGTTQDNADGWFMALTPRLVAGTWVGADDPGIRFRTTALGQGAHMALPVFAEFYKKVSADKEYRGWTRAQFPELTAAAKRKLDCDLYKTDMTFMERLFGKNEETEKRAFGEKKKKDGFFKRLFSPK